MFKAFRTRKMGAVLVLGFASGLPLYLTGRTLQAWMTVAGVNLSAIGFFGLVSLPYSLKFLWSPFIDRFSLPFFGRRKGWLFATQLALTAAIAAMAFQKPPRALEIVALNALAIAFFSATQDIAVDAYRTDILESHELGPGSSVYVLGYRAAMVVTGALALVLADKMSWPAVYLALGILMAAVSLLCLRTPEPPRSAQPPSSLGEAVRLPFVDFFNRSGTMRGAAILAFIVLYRLGDAMINNMTTSFLLQTGFSQTDIGVVQGGLGLLALIAGVLAGGAGISRIGMNRALWIFGALQAASNIAYLVLAEVGRNYPFMVSTILIENFCTGLGTAALFAFLMSLCNPRFSATQYALLSSMMAAGRDVLASPSGSIAQISGWPLFFVISIVAAMPGMALLPAFAPWRNTEAGNQ